MKQSTSYLPSKKFLMIVIIIIILGAIAYGISRFAPSAPSPAADKAAADVVVRAPAGYDPNADNDGDGLPNWEEALWGTNPDNSDTDGDRTSDSVELSERRNPLVNALNDTLTAYPLTPSVQSVDSGYANRTDSVSQSFLSHLYSMGVSGDSTGKATVLNDILATEASQNRLTDVYTKKDILIVPTTKDVLHAYGNVFGTQIKLYEQLGAPYEAAIIRTSMQTGKPADLKQLDRFVTFFAGTRDILLTTPVTNDLVAAHLELVNAINNMDRALTMIESSETDPVTGLLGMTEYQTAMGRINTAVSAYTKLCANKKVSFTADEPGFVFINH